MICFHPILAESSSLNGLINFILLILSTTALPGLIGFIVLLVSRFRPPAARFALVLGLLTVAPAGICSALLWWHEAWKGHGLAAGLSLLLGLVTCGLAWWSCGRPALPDTAITASGGRP